MVKIIQPLGGEKSPNILGQKKSRNLSRTRKITKPLGRRKKNHAIFLDKGTKGKRDKGTTQEQMEKGTTQEQRNKGTTQEQRNKRIKEQRDNTGTKKQRNKGTKEQRNKGTKK